MQFYLSSNNVCFLLSYFSVCICTLGYGYVSVCVCFGSLLLPLVSKVFHSEPDEIPPASTAAIRRRIMQSSPQANTLTHTQTQVGFTLRVCVCVCVVGNMAEELITHPQLPFLSRASSCLGEKACGKDRNTKMDR